MNEKKKRFRGLHSFLKNGTHYVYVYSKEGDLLAHVTISGKHVRLISGDLIVAGGEVNEEKQVSERKQDE